MTFKENTLAMLVELGNNYTEERHRELLAALCTGLAKAFGLISDHDKMHFIMENVLSSLEMQACAEQQEIYGKHEGTLTVDSKQLTYEQFLRDVFQPDHMND